VTNILITVLALVLTVNFSQASDFMVVEGKLTDSTGLNPIEDLSVDFTLSIYGDTANNCLLYKETFSAIDMSGSKGFFSFKLGKGSVVAGNFLNSINNKYNHTGLTCTTGTIYNPTATSYRKLEISYNNGSGLQTLSQKIDIGASAFANYAYSLEGKVSSDFIQVNTASGKQLTQANLEAVFASSSTYTELMALINGTSSQYNSGAPIAPVNMNSQRVTSVAAPTVGTDATNKNYVDANLGSRAVDTVTMASLSAGQAGQVLSWDGTQWTSTAPTGDNTKLPLAGGTMTGDLNMGAANILNANNISLNNNLTVSGGIGVATGINSAGIITIDPINVAAGDGGRLSLKELAMNGTNSVSLRSPDSLAIDLIFTLPSADGTSGQVLQTDGAGNLSWSNTSSPITSVFGRTGVVTSAASDYTASQIDNTAAGNVASTNVQAAINELDAEKVAKAGDSMTGHLIIGQTSQLRLGDADDSNYVGFVSPAIVSSNVVWELPANDGTSGQMLQTNGSGQLNWVSPAAAGEINTVSNQGVGGVGIFDNKSGTDIQLRNINAGSSKITVALDSPNKEVDINVNEANFNQSLIPNTPAGNIAATNIQAAINELDAEKGDFKIDGSMPMSGNLNMAGSSIIQVAAGTMASPSISMNGDSDTGMYSPNPNEIAFSVGGSDALRLMSGNVDINNNLNVSGPINAGDYTSFNPNLLISTGDSLILNANTSNITGSIIFKTDSPSTERMRVTNTGNVGIGTTTPQTKLDVNGSIKLGYTGSGGACSIPGSIQKSSIGMDLMFCDGTNWIFMAKQNPLPTLNNATIKDFAVSPIIYTTNPCAGGISLYNLSEGIRYQLIIKSNTSGTCAFTAYSGAGTGALTVRMPNGHGPTTASYHTMYEFTVVGPDTYVKWFPGQ
jgi:hypothetical protein